MSDDIFEVTLVLTTWVTATYEAEATAIVHDSLPDQIEFGDRAFNMALPFEYESLTARKVREEDLPRP